MRVSAFRRGSSADWREATRLALALCLLAPGLARAADPSASGDPSAAADPSASGDPSAAADPSASGDPSAAADPTPPPDDPAAAPDPKPTPDPAASPPLRQVGEVTASATRGEREVLDVPGNVSVIDREEIERSGARTLPELLRREPGIFVTNTTTNPAGTFVDARGFNNGGGNGAGLLVLVDGRRANEPDTGSADWALLPLDMIESVEIVRGPASALYGDGAIAGILHIRTRPAEGPPRGALRGRYGRYDTGGGSLRAAGTFHELTGGIFVDGLDTDGYRDRSAYDSFDAKGSLEGTLFDRVVIGSSGGHHHDDREFPGTLTDDEINVLGRRASQPGTAKNRGEVDTWFWDGWLEAALAPQLELKLLPYFFTRDDSSRDVSILFGPFEIENQKNQGGVDLELRVDTPILDLANRLTLGASYLHDEIDRSSIGTDFSQRTKGERNVFGGFVQEELWLRQDLLLAAGVRYDSGRYDLETRNRILDVSQDETPDFDAWSPKASLTWRFLPVASAYLALARGFRLPDFDEDLPIIFEGFDPSGPPPIIILIPDLKLQRSDSIEVGTKLESEAATAGLSLYWMRVRDELLFDPLTFANRNIDRVRHRGIEVSGSYRPFSWLTLVGAYTFDDVKIVEDTNADLDGARMPVTPKHRGTLGAFVGLPVPRAWADVELGANANLVGERILVNDFRRELSELDAYQTVDLWLRVRRSFVEPLAASFVFAVRNVAGQRYDDVGAIGTCPPPSFGRLCDTDARTAFFYPAPTRTWEVGLSLEWRP
jgi:outer membrane receptor protein involved in Fe transport